MKVEVKARVVYELQGYKIRQILDGKKYTSRYGVYAGKYPVNEKKGYDNMEQAKEVINQLIAGTITKTLIKNKR